MTHRKDKETMQLYEGQVKDIRQQLDHQLRCLDQRSEQQVSIVTELQEFFRRKADVEIEHSKSLERLAKNLVQKQKTEKQRRDQWPLCSIYSLYQTLIHVTKKQSRDHAVFGELLQNNLVNRLVQTGEDLTRIYKRCREIGVESHEELFKVHNELHTALKTYFLSLNEFRQTETKFRFSEEQKMKVRDSLPEEKRLRNRKLKVWTKETAKKEAKFEEARLKLLKARNEYLLSLNSANAALHKYFAEDLPELMDCMDFGLHRAVCSAMKIHQGAVEQIEMRKSRYEEEVKNCLENFDSRADKQKFIEAHHSVFMLPRKFDVQSQIGDDVKEVKNDGRVQEELLLRLGQLEHRLMALRTENEEIWKTLDSAERTLIKMIDTVDCDVEALFNANGPASLAEEKRLLEAQTNGTPLPPPTTPTAKLPETAVIKKKADKAEIEQFYLSKFQEYTLNSNLMTRLQAKQKLLQNALSTDPLNGGGAVGGDSLNGTGGAGGAKVGSALVARHSTLPPKVRRRRIAQLGSASQRPKLFGGSLEEFFEASEEEIPLILTSCIKVIRQFGFYHQGIFRVSGSQVEINAFRDAFERGEDPLVDVRDGRDINSVAGVFKLYLRELREPLFPLYMFDQLMEISKVDDKDEFVKQIRELLMSLPRPVFVVLRYLIAFLNHLSEFSDENMMDRFNLAICFGPTLLPIPESRDQVQYQQRVNVLIKNIFLYQDDIFPTNFGTIYEKYNFDIYPSEPINESINETNENLENENNLNLNLNLKNSENNFNNFNNNCNNNSDEEDAEYYEATAVYSFKARNSAELTIQKGDALFLLTQMNSEWWKARLLTPSSPNTQTEGLVPDKYVEIKRRISSNGGRNGSSEIGTLELQTSMTESLGSVSSTATSVDDGAVSLSLLTDTDTGTSDTSGMTVTDSSKSDEDADCQSPWRMPADHLIITERTPREEREERKKIQTSQTTQAIHLPVQTSQISVQTTHLPVQAMQMPVQTTQVPPSPRSPKVFGGVPRYYFGNVSPSPAPSGGVRSAFPAFGSMRIHPDQTNRSLSSTSTHMEEHADTPDLVLNLPLKSDSPSFHKNGNRQSEDGRSLQSDRQSDRQSDNSPDATVAEQFARSNQGTMKKGKPFDSDKDQDKVNFSLGSYTESLNKPTNQSTNQSINRSINQPNSQSPNRSINQSTSQYNKVVLPLPKYEVTAFNSAPSASIDELLESLKAVASPALTDKQTEKQTDRQTDRLTDKQTDRQTGAESPRPAVAPKPVQLKPTTKVVVGRKPLTVASKNAGETLGRTVRDASSKPTSC